MLSRSVIVGNLQGPYKVERKITFYEIGIRRTLSAIISEFKKISMQILPNVIFL